VRNLRIVRKHKENNAMDTRTRLHPLLTAAAISITVFSVFGIGAVTGLIPTSIGSQKEKTTLQEEATLQIPEEVAKPIEPAITHPAPAPVKKVARALAAKPKATAPVAYNDYATPPPPQVAQAPVYVPETPKPAVKPGALATIQSVREVQDPGEHTALGPIAGGIAGAVLGDRIGKGHGTRKVITLIGAAGGALAGREIEKRARGTSHWEIDVRRDDGAYVTVRSDVAPPWQPGERVRLLDGRLQPV
jgi:outer membrane lipoprotein SlyB